MKIALVQDWFVVNGGAEKVVKEILHLYPDATIFSLVDFLNDRDRKDILNGKYATTSYLQKMPFAKKHYRFYLPIFPNAIESLDFTGYDLIISSSYAVAKGIKKKENQIHICYCHSPVRYAWDLKKEYLSSLSWFAQQLSKPVLNYIRNWDQKTTSRVDMFIANSNNVAERIKRIYNRESVVIYPPVDTEAFTPFEQKDDYYFTSMRVVPYKKLDLIVDAFTEMPDKKLVVAGDGPDLEKIKIRAGKNIIFKGFVEKPELVNLMQRAKAFVLAAEEDFGITSLEAQSCCTPVIAYKKGGYLETVIEGKTGVFFDQPNVASLKKTINDFENSNMKFNKADFEMNVSRFANDKFRKAFKDCVEEYCSITNQN
jgi:glycosyltransferase involved in cell wall biosynthesis